jgi:hypothetical protein
MIICAAAVIGHTHASLFYQCPFLPVPLVASNVLWPTALAPDAAAEEPLEYDDTIPRNVRAPRQSATERTGFVMLAPADSDLLYSGVTESRHW